MSAPGHSLQARLSRVALDCFFSINRTTGFSSSQREILVLPFSGPCFSLSSAKILAVDDILADMVWEGW